jgi:transposase
MGAHIGSLHIENTVKDEMERLIRKASTPQALALRMRIVLMAASGTEVNEIVGRLATTRATVRKWRERFLRHGLEGLKDGKRPGAPSRHPDCERDLVISASSQSERPSIRTIARELKIDRGFVERVLYAARARSA